MKRIWTKLRLYSATYARPILLTLIAIVGISLLFVYELSSLLPGLSRPELQSLAFSDGLEAIRYNPVNAPVTLAQYFLQTSRFDSIAYLRLASSLLGLVAVFIFYRVARSWYSQTVSWLGTFLFASSSWLLHSSRLATALVLQILVILLVFLGVELQRNKGSKPTLFFGTVITAILLYVPGMMWIVLAGIVWQRSRIYRAFRRNEGWFVVVCGVLGISLVLPLVLAIFVDPLILRPLLGVPERLPSVVQFANNLLQVPLQLLVRGPADPVIWLGRLPLIEIFSGLMFLVGLYACSKTMLLDRVRLLFGLGIGLWLLVALGGSVQIAVLLPVVFLVIISGISYLLQSWLTIFPRNPVARGVGIVLMSVAVGSAMYYNTQSYFVAWPNAPVTKAAFSHKQK